MKVILHADDFGYDKDTLKATIDCFDKGALTSCTIMVNGEASEEALEYARQHPEFSFGVHLTYVDKLKPVASIKDIPSLVGAEGKFLPSNQVRKLAMALRIPQKQIVIESQAQIDKMEKAGIKVSHLDSHGHLHKFFSFLFALKYLQIGGENVKRIRSTQNVFLNHPPKISPIYWFNKYFRWYLERNFKCPQYFYMSANSMDTRWSDAIIAQMDKLPQDAIIEIGVHPGYKEEWRRHEYDDIIDFAEKLRSIGKHQIINWNKV